MKSPRTGVMILVRMIESKISVFDITLKLKTI